MPINLPFRPRRDAYPPDLWTKCPSCGEMLFNKQLDKASRVCPHCGHHFRLSANRRIALLLDQGTFRERDAGLESVDALEFVDSKPYRDRLAAAQLATGLREAAIWGTGKLDDHEVAICVLDFQFIGGSMGSVVGEKVARAAEAAMAERLPLLIVSSSGGARMQEGTYSLMQLVKTLAAIERLKLAGVPYISLLCDPTTGGVFASFAVVGDINVAEPNALIGFAGERVASGTIAEEFPPGFQRAEFLLNHGFIDRIVPRAELKSELSRLLDYLVAPKPAAVTVEPQPQVGFRPLSFLTGLSERRLPEAIAGNGSAGNGVGGKPGSEAVERPPASPERPGTRARRGPPRSVVPEHAGAAPVISSPSARPGSTGPKRNGREKTLAPDSPAQEGRDG